MLYLLLLVSTVLSNWREWRGPEGQGVSAETHLPTASLTGQDGDTFVIQAGPEQRVLATSSVGEPVYASPAISQGSFFLRGAKHLFRIGS